jgi:hypothetical protein
MAASKDLQAVCAELSRLWTSMLTLSLHRVVRVALGSRLWSLVVGESEIIVTTNATTLERMVGSSECDRTDLGARMVDTSVSIGLGRGGRQRISFFTTNGKNHALCRC